MRKKKKEFSKIILAVIGAASAVVTVFSMIAVLITGDTTPLAYLIPAVFGELATATGFYYSKAKAENKIKLTKKYGRDIVETAVNFEQGEN